MEICKFSTYYNDNREKVLQKAHQFVLCPCGERIKYNSLSSHRTHSPRHRIYEQMNKSVNMKSLY